MDPGGPLDYLSGLWILPLILVFVWLGMLFLVKYWQNQVNQGIKKFMPGFNQLQVESKQILDAMRGYSHDDPPPYGALVASLNHQLDEIANDRVALQNRYIKVQGEKRRLKFRLWQEVIAAPFYWYTWYSLRREIKSLTDQIALLQGSVAAIKDGVREIERQAWLVVKEVQAALDIERQIRALIEKLGDQRFTGDTFEVAAAQEEVIIDELDQIPRYFFAATEETIATQASKESVCRVYASVKKLKPLLDDLHNRLSTWDDQYSQLAKSIGEAKQQLLRTGQLLDLIPEAIQSTDIKNQYRTLTEIGEQLAATLTRLEVEQIRDAGEEAERVRRAAVELGNQIRRGIRQYNTFSSLSNEIAVLQKDLSGVISSLAKKDSYPITWDQSRSQFRELNKEVNALGEINKPRTFEQIDRDLDAANGLYVRLKTLYYHCDEVSRGYAELIAYLESDGIRMGLDWYEGTLAVASQVALYHPDNWLKSESAGTFPEDIRYLAAKHRSLVPADASISLKESEIGHQLARIQSLVDEQKALRARREKIEARLTWLQSVDNSTREELLNTRNHFHQLVWIVNSNEFLKSMAASELDQYQKNLDQLNLELHQPQTGLVEKKARAARGLMDELENTGNRWLSLLHQEILKKEDSLRITLVGLREYAILEDPAIDRVQRLIGSEPHHLAEVGQKPVFHFSLSEIIAELRERSNLWQECTAAQKELEEVVESPLLDAVRNAENQRQFALNLYTNTKARAANIRTWPPTSVSLDQEQRDFDQLEADWKSIRAQRGRAIWAVRRYGEMAAKYQSLTVKLEKGMQWAAQEQKRVVDLENEIGRLMTEIQLQEQAYRDNPYEVERLQRLRTQASRSCESVRNNWISDTGKGDGEISYDDVLNDLMKVLQMLRSATDRLASVRSPDNQPLSE